MVTDQTHAEMRQHLGAGIMEMRQESSSHPRSAGGWRNAVWCRRLSAAGDFAGSTSPQSPTLTVSQHGTRGWCSRVFVQRLASRETRGSIWIRPELWLLPH